MGYPGQPQMVYAQQPQQTTAIYYVGTQKAWAFKPAMPHVKQMCRHCQGTHVDYRKGRPCKYCVCEKCGGDGWREDKNKACKKMKIKDD
jgi:hypothetical protein